MATINHFAAFLDGRLLRQKIYKAGEQLSLPFKAIHNEGAVGSSPLKLVATYVVEKGQPLVQPIK